VIAALYVAKDGCYYGIPDVDPWDEERDARLYAGPHPVVAHPPCHLWVNMAAVNWKRYQRQRPAWYPGGDDGGCFASALDAVRRFGGVLEHPAFSHAWLEFGLLQPSDYQWTQCADTTSEAGDIWVCEVWQSAYGHRARKRTWLLFCGAEQPADLNWERNPGTAQCGWFDRNKPTLSKREALSTPIPFRDLLLEIARGAISNPAEKSKP
jgi:hypothetical protein